MASGLITSWQVEGEKKETVLEKPRLYVLDIQNHCVW